MRYGVLRGVVLAGLMVSLSAPVAARTSEEARKIALDAGEALMIAEWCAERGLSFSDDDLQKVLGRFLEVTDVLSEEVAENVASELVELKSHLRQVTPAACAEHRLQAW